jgi:hypothetical protein
LTEGETALLAQLKKTPKDDNLRYSLGTLQFLQSVEHLTQSLYKYGLEPNRILTGTPIVRLPVPTNPKPEAVSYEQLRAVYQTWLDDLKKAEETLSGIKSNDVKIPVRFGLIRLDFNKDGKTTEDEALWKIYARLNRDFNASTRRDEQPGTFLIHMDAGDVQWLRGYCHLLSAMGEFILAHDWQQAFERVGHVFFANVTTPHAQLQAGRKVFPWGDHDGMDFIATLHLARFEVVEPQRMQQCLAHLQAVIAHGRTTWTLILAEKDDDHEWLPNPQQTGVVGVPISPEMIESWRGVLDEAEAVLAGKLLIPYWRGNGDQGVNLNRVFTEPTTFDLVLWVQGSGVTQYLEKGTISSPETWQRLTQVFGGEFIGFAFWFN